MCFQQHRGRVVDAPGDNILAEFVSVVDAVSCAAAIQKKLFELNAQLPAERKMQFRIGINLGDVVEERETEFMVTGSTSPLAWKGWPKAEGFVSPVLQMTKSRTNSI
jgi:class 3 adenylate cyclase